MQKKAELEEYENVLLWELLSVDDLATYISLMDKDELNAEDMTWEEIQPYIRALGVTSQDLAQPSPKNLAPQLQIQLEAVYSTLKSIFNSEQPELLISKVAQERTASYSKLSEIKNKQTLCIKKNLEVLKKIQETLSEIESTIAEQDKENTECKKLEVKTQVLSLKIEYLDSVLEQELYNSETLPALQKVKQQLEDFLDEQEDLKAILNSKIQRFEQDETLKEIAQEYSEVVAQINVKKRDLAKLK